MTDVSASRDTPGANDGHIPSKLHWAYRSLVRYGPWCLLGVGVGMVAAAVFSDRPDAVLTTLVVVGAVCVATAALSPRFLGKWGFSKEGVNAQLGRLSEIDPEAIRVQSYMKGAQHAIRKVPEARENPEVANKALGEVLAELSAGDESGGMAFTPDFEFRGEDGKAYVLDFKPEPRLSPFEAALLEDPKASRAKEGNTEVEGNEG
jgi:hypothetical protein